MDERIGLLADWTTVSKGFKYEQTQNHTKLDEMFVRGDKLLFLKDSTTLNATVILYFFSLPMFFDLPFWESFYIVMQIG